MRFALLCIAFFGSLLAAQPALTVSPAVIAPGGSGSLTVTFADTTPTAALAGLEWTLALPAGITAGSLSAGAAATAAGKVLTCGPAGLCILIGNGSAMNETAIASGVVATIPITAASTATPGASTVSLGAVGGTTGPGIAASVAGGSATVTIQSRYDLNGDGVVNAADVTIMLNEADGANACAASSTGVGDGKCGLADVELEILAALGVIH